MGIRWNTDEGENTVVDKQMIEELCQQERKFVPWTERIDPHEKILLYGPGQFSEKILSLLQSENYPVIGYMGRNAKQHPMVRGLPCWLPEEIPAEQRKEYLVVLSTFWGKYPHDPIIQSLREVGFCRFFDGGKICALNAFREPLSEKPPVDQVWEAFSLLQDELSREIFYRNLRAHIKDEYDDALCQEDLIQYFRPGLKLNKGFSRLVDCGAYIGDSLESALQCGELDEYYGFEPDSKNFQELSATVDKFKEHIGKAILFPCACGGKNELLSFVAQGTSSSYLAQYYDKHQVESVTIQAVKLDDIFKKVSAPPTMIKMDIESAEPDALMGAKGLIQTYQPDLTICVYHKIPHLWEIPLMIHAMVPEYQFYLRCHDQYTLETVLYATVPND
jgi:FkbM family methyltransferase